MTRLALIFILLGFASTGTAATTISKSFTITILASLAVTVTPTTPQVPCNAAAGTAVAALGTTGGDGNAVSYALAGSTDLAVSGASIVVGPSGIMPGDCGTTENLTVTATQN